MYQLTNGLKWYLTPTAYWSALESAVLSAKSAAPAAVRQLHGKAITSTAREVKLLIKTAQADKGSCVTGRDREPPRSRLGRIDGPRTIILEAPGNRHGPSFPFYELYPRRTNAAL